MSMVVPSRALRLFVRTRTFSTAPPLRPRRLGRVLVLSSALTTSALGYAFYADASNTRTLSDLVRAYVVYGMCSITPLVDAAPAILDVLFGIPGMSKIVESFVRTTFFHQFVGAETAHGALPLVVSLRAENKGALFAYGVEVDEKEAARVDQEPVHKRIVNEMIRSINVAADFEDGRDTLQSGRLGRRTWIAVKLTALLPNAQSLTNLSIYLTHTRAPLEPPVLFPGTPSPSDFSLYNDLVRICTRAQERGVRVVIDAEYSWYQPAIDAFGHAMMERFNKRPSGGFQRAWWDVSSWISSPSTTEASHDRVQPLVYVTYQAYLRRMPAHLAHSLALARKRGYALGVKLVRGAYHPHELAAHQLARSPTSPAGSSSPKHSHSHSLSISPDPEPPVQPSKDATDQCYHDCVTLLVDAISGDLHRSDVPGIGVIFGTHNWTSCEFVLEELVKKGLGVVERAGTDGLREDVVRIPPEVGEMITFGQLYGMSDALTNYLVGRTRCEAPCVIKHVPYGALVEVMPYLSRRAIENKSVLGAGGATRERKDAAALIWKKIKGLVGL
ncbi:FAD-linked oxidoreductase-like protein [Suillus ampliporus]|nr:FAD-linked oxidoreductase-like protein [Suillus ampliporus]